MQEQVYRVKVTPNKTEWFNEKGQRHRLDGPAIEEANGSKSWWQHDQLHRLDGPAVEMANGYKAWYQKGQRHRLDGPAVEWADGFKAWFINGQELTETEFLKRTQPKELTMAEIAERFGIPVERLKIKKG